MTNPLLCHLTRGGIVESTHRGAICVASADGSVRLSLGDTKTDVFPRSAIKVIQAIPLLTSGAADAFGFTDAHLALACASHSGEPRHAKAAAQMLAACERSVDDLECGAHRPMDADTAWALARVTDAPTALHNNCSGKHAGMIATAVHLGEDPAGYVHLDHPVQRRIRKVYSDLIGTPLEAAPCGIDGCAVPTWAVPLETLAIGLARATGHAEKNGYAEIRRLVAASIAHPEMMSGAGRACAKLMRACKGDVYVKVGAEGVYCAILPGYELAVALKIDDGAKRAAEVVTATVLAHLLPSHASELASLVNRPLMNWTGMHVGDLGPSDTLMQALSAMAT